MDEKKDRARGDAKKEEEEEQRKMRKEGGAEEKRNPENGKECSGERRNRRSTITTYPKQLQLSSSSSLA